VPKTQETVTLLPPSLWKVCVLVRFHCGHDSCNLGLILERYPYCQTVLPIHRRGIPLLGDETLAGELTGSTGLTLRPFGSAHL
jgi:hypothetical protein